MSYDQNSVDQAKKKGLFNDKVFDPKALQLSSEEKEKIQKDINRHQPEVEEPPFPQEQLSSNAKPFEKKEFYVELNFFEKIYIVFLSFFSRQGVYNYRLNKALKNIEKSLNKYKPSVFNSSTQRITKFFAYKLHDVYLKILALKKVMEQPLNSESWDNPEQIHKTGLELLFEKIMDINSKEVDSNFSYQGIGRIIADFESSMKAGNAVENSIKAYLASLDKKSTEAANKIYTNLMYIKNLTEYDFISLFKRFDPQYNPGVSPAFNDIAAEALLPYLSDLEDILLQIDLNLDNVLIFKNLFDVSSFMAMTSEPSLIIEEGKMNNDNDSSVRERIENEFYQCFDALKDLLTKNYFTQLLQLIKRDPLYTPVIMHTNYDIYKLYCEIFEERINFIAAFIMKEKRTKKIDIHVKKIFTVFKWAGVYSIETSAKIEELGLIGFIYCYHLGIINTFLNTIYDETMKSILNLTVTNGLFIEKFFQKTVSDTFYSLDKFEEKLRDFIFDMKDEGVTGKKISSLLLKKEGNQIETRKTLERNTAYANTKAKELFDEFYPNFSLITDILTKLYNDIDTKPPKYLRNIRTIGGLKNSRYLSGLLKSYETIKSIKELILLLKE